MLAARALTASHQTHINKKAKKVTFVLFLDGEKKKTTMNIYVYKYCLVFQIITSGYSFRVELLDKAYFFLKFLVHIIFKLYLKAVQFKFSSSTYQNVYFLFSFSAFSMFFPMTMCYLYDQEKNPLSFKKLVMWGNEFNIIVRKIKKNTKLSKYMMVLII